MCTKGFKLTYTVQLCLKQGWISAVEIIDGILRQFANFLCHLSKTNSIEDLSFRLLKILFVVCESPLEIRNKADRRFETENEVFTNSFLKKLEIREQ